MNKYKISREEIVQEMKNVLACKGGVEHKVAPFLLNGWINDLLSTKPESDKERYPFTFHYDPINPLNHEEELEVEELEHIPDPYGKGWCIANKSMIWYAPDGDYHNQIDIIRRTQNQLIKAHNALVKEVKGK